MSDAADKVIEQWGDVRPSLDTTPIGVVVRILRAARLLEQGLKEYFDDNGLETWEYDVLATLLRTGEDGSLRMGDLAGAALVTAGALTNRIDRLVAKGLVTRATDAENRRTVRTTLTDRGRELADGLIEGHLANERDLIGALTEDEQQQLAALLRKLLLSLGD
ncbi:MarR family transcriptional regulator [Solihabitans fulvus]|uniref:MarR family transcriptional regulator n=1 Tax=Solihabitans fulvus TaxID=1892852 RepID=A0A5B2XJD1_9PSEU|nr:MarR family transcriptional regulator [Solihabitans fulvus]KAA2263376.1 MarR family transcriptional regulator [Solihabitans fulvus]